MNTYNTLACPACQNPVAADSQFCPHCGTQFAIPAAVDSPPVYGQQPLQPAVQQPLQPVPAPQYAPAYPQQVQQYSQQQITGYQQQVAQSYPQQPVSGYAQQFYVPQTQGKSRLAYILLGVFFGSLGIHNFYAGYIGKAIAQLAMTIFGVFLIEDGAEFGAVLIGGARIWSLVEVFIIKTDAKGLPLRS